MIHGLVRQRQTRLDPRNGYQSLSYEEQEAGFQAAGLPEWIYQPTLTLFRSWTETSEHPVSPDYDQITKMPPTDIEKFAADFAKAF